jgi:hypothetical protein
LIVTGSRWCCLPFKIESTRWPCRNTIVCILNSIISLGWRCIVALGWRHIVALGWMPLVALSNSAGYDQLSMHTCVGIYSCRAFTKCTRRWGAGVHPVKEQVQSRRVGLREWISLSAEGQPPWLD